MQLYSYICDDGDLNPLRLLLPRVTGTPVDSARLWIKLLGQCRVWEPLRRQCQRRAFLCQDRDPTYVISLPGSAAVCSRFSLSLLMTLKTWIQATQPCTPHSKQCPRLRHIMIMSWRIPHRPVGIFTPLPRRRTPRDRDPAIPLSELTV